MFDPLKSKAKVLIYTSTAFLLGLGMASGLGWTGASHASTITLDQQPRVDQEVMGAALELSDAFVGIADAVTPAVVSIRTERRGENASGNRNQIPEQFRDFFDNLPQGQQQPIPQFSGGSGFVISSDGYIVTNNHVVQGADEIMVSMQNRREYPAEVVGTDPTTDLAVLKIDGSDLPTASFGNSQALRVGEWVVAVGNPGFAGSSAGQLDYTVTAGIVSAKARSLDIIRRTLEQDPNFDASNAGFAIESFIQTDAVINPGNSGGPLVNLAGQVVGVNSAIVSRTGYYQGYGFAIPADVVRRVIEDLIEYGRVRRAILGVSIMNVSPVDAEAYGLPSVAGIFIQDFTPDSPAEEAGLEREDIIVEVNGDLVGSTSELQSAVAQLRPGDTAEVMVYRDGRPRTFEIELGEAPFTLEAAAAPEPEVTAEDRLGLAVRNLDAETADQLGYSNPGGVVISSVLPGGPAWDQQVPTGWRIVEINDRAVQDADDVEALLGEADGGSIVKLDLRSPAGDRRIVNVRMPS